VVTAFPSSSKKPRNEVWGREMCGVCVCVCERERDRERERSEVRI
jgi:hypothetical protein